VRHVDVKVNLGENKKLFDDCQKNANRGPSLANSDKKDSNGSQVTSNNILNDKLKSLGLKKIFVLNNIEYLFKDEESNFSKIIKSLLDFFEVSSYPFLITTYPKNAQLLGDY
jgi:hypothetical protein